MNNLKETLEKIKENPIIYLGKPSLTRLKSFLDGYMVCMRNMNNDSSIDFYPGFQEFIAKKYKIEITKNCLEIIEFFSFGEEQAFYKFFELLDEFQNKQEHKCKHGDG